MLHNLPNTAINACAVIDSVRVLLATSSSATSICHASARLLVPCLYTPLLDEGLLAVDRFGHACARSLHQIRHIPLYKTSLLIVGPYRHPGRDAFSGPLDLSGYTIDQVQPPEVAKQHVLRSITRSLAFLTKVARLDLVSIRQVSNSQETIASQAHIFLLARSSRVLCLRYFGWPPFRAKSLLGAANGLASRIDFFAVLGAACGSLPWRLVSGFSSGSSFLSSWPTHWFMRQIALYLYVVFRCLNANWQVLPLFFVNPPLSRPNILDCESSIVQGVHISEM